MSEELEETPEVLKTKEKYEKKLRRKHASGLQKLSPNDREVVLQSKDETERLVQYVWDQFSEYRVMRTHLQELQAKVAEAEAEASKYADERDCILTKVNETLSKLSKLNPGCCPDCGLMGKHPKGYGCNDRYCEDNAYRSTNICYSPLYWGKIFTKEEYDNLYCNRVSYDNGSDSDDHPCSGTDDSENDE